MVCEWVVTGTGVEHGHSDDRRYCRYLELQCYWLPDSMRQERTMVRWGISECLSSTCGSRTVNGRDARQWGLDITFPPVERQLSLIWTPTTCPVVFGWSFPTMRQALTTTYSVRLWTAMILSIRATSWLCKARQPMRVVRPACIRGRRPSPPPSVTSMATSS